MSEQLPERLERASAVGRGVVSVLVREPVKEAVREALLEEQMQERASPEARPREADRDGDDGRTFPVKTMATVIAIAGVILLVQRLRRRRSTDRPPHPATDSGRGGRAGTDRSTTSRPER